MVGALRAVAIIGVGLIGGSIGLALRQRGLAEQVVGVGRRRESLEVARQVGAITHATTNLAEGVAHAELVVVCTPVGRIAEDILAAAEHCPPGTLLTDAGSTKETIVETLAGRLPRDCRFLGSHPVAGSEKTGPGHARANLFEGRVTILTPTEQTTAADLGRLTEFWSSLGSTVLRMSPVEHDLALAVTSHLPHLAASALAATVPEKLYPLCGSGVFDTTRVAAGDPSLWRQIFTANRGNLLAALGHYQEQLAAFRLALEQGDETAVEHLLTLAKKNRDALGS